MSGTPVGRSATQADPAGTQDILARGAPVNSAYPFLQPAAQDDELGRLGNYRILKLLGEGGMGVVFLAEDTALRRPVALKLMKPGRDFDQGRGPERFLREARAMASIKNDHLVTVYQVGRVGLVVYLAMELLEGETLESRLRRAARPEPKEILRLGREIATGLAAIHRKGLIHRDIKPGNLWLEAPGGRVKILDFGLARDLTDDDIKLTQSGMVLGTPAYLSPEQARGKPADARSDLFCLGGVLYQLCTGSIPFPAENSADMMVAVATADPVPIRSVSPDTPAPLAGLVTKLLAKNPDDRPQSADEVIAAITKIERGTGAKVPLNQAAPAARAPKLAAPAPKPVPEPAPLSLPAPVPAANPRVNSPRPRPAASIKRTSKKKARRQPAWVLPVLIGCGVLLGVLVTLGAVRLFGGKKESPESGNTGTTTKGIQEQQQRSTPAAVQRPEPNATYLTELEPVSKQFPQLGEGPPPGGLPGPPPFPPGPPGGGPGPQGPPPQSGPMRVSVGGTVSQHGIFMHAAPPHLPPCRVGYDLGRRYRKFKAGVGINSTAGRSKSPVVFRVYADGELQWESQPVPESAPPVVVDLDVTDVKTLTLEVTTRGPDVGGAHGAWVEPMLTK